MSDLVRIGGLALWLVGAILILLAVLQTYVDAIMLLCGAAAMFAGGAIMVGGCAVDLLADHPDEMEDARRRAADARAHRLAADERRRLGLAGWQKPVAPPSDEDRPGGLPPRR